MANAVYRSVSRYTKFADVRFVFHTVAAHTVHANRLSYCCFNSTSANVSFTNTEMVYVQI